MISSPRFALGLGLLLCACGEGDSPGERPEPGARDVVLVLVDTLRCDFTDLTPGGRSHTPFLAELAREAVVFENAYSPAPWTLPSVASLISGLHVAEHGVVDVGKRLPESVPTLAERLAEVGYRTMAVYANPYAGPLSGLDRGFAVSLLAEGQTGRPELAALLDAELDDAPALLYIHNTEPHDPHALSVNRGPEASAERREFSQWYGQRVAGYRFATRRSVQRGAQAGVDLDAAQQAYLDDLRTRQEEAYEIYAVSVQEADARIRGIVDELRARGRWEETLFVVMADHGEEMGEHGGWLHDQSLYEELTHVPLLVRFPRGEFGGTRVSRAASLVDLMPTVLSCLGLEANGAPLQGRDWTTALRRGAEENEQGPRVVSVRMNTQKHFGPWAESRGDRNVSVRQGHWKAIWSIEPDRLELYDLETDPGEQDDVSAREPELSQDLRALASARWYEMRARESAEEGGGLEAANPRALESLRELGYIGEDE